MSHGNGVLENISESISAADDNGIRFCTTSKLEWDVRVHYYLTCICPPVKAHLVVQNMMNANVRDGTAWGAGKANIKLGDTAVSLEGEVQTLR